MNTENENTVAIVDRGDSTGDTTLKLNDRPLLHVSGYEVERVVGDMAKVTFTIFVKKATVDYVL